MFGLKSIINIFYFTDFILDNKVSITNKIKVVVSLSVSIIYALLSIDLIPEMFLGGVGFIDDIVVIITALSILSNEIDDYRILIKKKNEKIIDFAKYKTKD